MDKDRIAGAAKEAAAHRRMPRMMMDRKVSPATATVTARDH
jgi:hypothetical protein